MSSSSGVSGGSRKVKSEKAKLSVGIKYYCTFQNTIADVLAARGWNEVDSEVDWDFVWADREWSYAAFDKMHLEPWQRLNHFRNGRELCRKDLMAKNIKKRRRALEKEGRVEEALSYDFIPSTFVLPKDYSMFVEEFKKIGGIWIMKPIGAAQGKGNSLLLLYTCMHIATSHIAQIVNII